MNKSKFLKNMVFGFGGQFIIIILGIIIPRIMITSYGSDVNGLTSTVTQIFTYMALLEAGIGQAARNAMYKPITENNRKDFSYVVSVAQTYFRRITVYYGIGVIILSFIVPFIVKSQVPFYTIFLVVFFEGMSGVISFYFIQTQTIILTAEGRHYINSGVNVINKALSYVVKIVMAMLGINIAALQFAFFIITIGKVFFYRYYFRKNYNWIDYKAAPKSAKLVDRNSYIITEIAWTLFSSTDMIVLSTFVSTQMSSVYAVYNMVFSNLNVLLNAVYSGLSYMLGQSFHEDLNRYGKLHDMFTSVFLGSMTTLMCIAYILMIPFVRLYTRGVTDINYIYNSLPTMFALVQILSWSRYVSGNLTGLAGYAKQVSKISLIEALMNIILSIALVHSMGIVGVLMATVAALPLKVIYCVFLTEKKILHRSLRKTILILGVNYLMFAATVVANKFLVLNINDFLDFIVYGLIVSLVCGLVGISLNVLVNRDCVNIAVLLLKEKGRKV